MQDIRIVKKVTQKLEMITNLHADRRYLFDFLVTNPLTLRFNRLHFIHSRNDNTQTTIILVEVIFGLHISICVN